MALAVPGKLVASILEGRCVAFVGAGYSAAAVPTWSRLLERIAAFEGVNAETRERVGGLMASGEPLAFEAAAQLLLDVLGPAFSEELASILEAPSENDVMKLRREHLSGIPFRGILTTNFDGLLKGLTPGRTAYREVLRPGNTGWYEERYWRGKGAPVVKLHGCVTKPDTVVLTRRDYRRRLYSDPAYATFLRSVFAGNTLLFLGCSFNDPYLNELRSEVLSLLDQKDFDEPLAYAVVPDQHEARRDFFRNHEGMKVISYDTTQAADHEPFDDFLAQLYRQTNPVYHLGRLLEGKRLIWLDPNPNNNEAGIKTLRNAARWADAGFTLDEVTDVEGALAQLATPCDLLITHWGHGPHGSNAERLLKEIRSRDLQAPVIVFASGAYAEQNKRRALKAGAIGYCFLWSTLFRRLADVFDHGRNTG
jgi:hypothetical protein